MGRRLQTQEKRKTWSGQPSWGDGHEFSFAQAEFRIRIDILLRRMVVEACERGELGYEFRVVSDAVHKHRTRSNENTPFTLHRTHRSIRRTILLHQQHNYGEEFYDFLFCICYPSVL